MLKAFGKVTVPSIGTPVQATSGQASPDDKHEHLYHSGLIQVWYENTGKIWLGTQTMNKATGAGVYCVLPAPTASSIPSINIADVMSRNGVQLSDIWIDADVNDEGVLVTPYES